MRDHARSVDWGAKSAGHGGRTFVWVICELGKYRQDDARVLATNHAGGDRVRAFTGNAAETLRASP